MKCGASILMKFIPILLLLTLYSLSQKVEWLRSNPFACSIQGKNVIVNDKNKNSFVLIQGMYPGTGLFFIKYDSLGNKAWEKNYQGYGGVGSIATDKENCVYITVGALNLTVEGTQYINNDLGLTTLFVKYDSNGNFIWIKKSRTAVVLAETTNAQNSLIVSGTANDTTYLENNNVLYPFQDAQGNHGDYIARLNTNGEYLTTAQILQSFSPLIVGNDGSMFATADIYSDSVTLGNTNKVMLYQANGASYIARYSAALELMWVKQVDCWAATSDAFGNTYLLKQEGSNAAINKYDLNGNWLWRRTQLSVGQIYKAQMKCDAIGNLFFSGCFRDYLTLGDTTINCAGYTRAFVAKFNSEGKLKWITASGGDDGASVKDISIRGNEIFITGEIGSGTVTFGDQIVTGQGGVYTAKLTDNDVTVAINNIADNLTNKYQIYPNPTNGFLTITGPSPSAGSGEQINLKIENVMGQLIYSKRINTVGTSLNETIDLSKWPKGIYFIQINTGSTTEARKIVLE